MDEEIESGAIANLIQCLSTINTLKCIDIGAYLMVFKGSWGHEEEAEMFK